MYVEQPTIPEGMTVDEYRRSRTSRDHRLTVTLRVTERDLLRAKSLLGRLLNRNIFKVESIHEADRP
jgi:hypothetical protein